MEDKKETKKVRSHMIEGAKQDWKEFNEKHPKVVKGIKIGIIAAIAVPCAIAGVDLGKKKLGTSKDSEEVLDVDDYQVSEVSDDSDNTSEVEEESEA